MLSLWRRHLHECPHRNKGREYTKCSCPIWCDGNLKGKRHRQSLKIRNWQRALRLADHLEHPETERFDLIPCEQRGCNHRVESGRCEKHRRTLKEAIAIFFSAHPDLGHETLRNYTRALKFLAAHVEKAKLQWVDEITADEIESLRPTRKISALTWSKELEILRQFFRYCVARKWTSESPASKEAGVKMPKNIKPTDKEPYDPNDVVKICCRLRCHRAATVRTAPGSRNDATLALYGSTDI
jgi:hypothetical protein